MKESVVTFGPDEILVGVLTEPAERRPNSPVIVMSNVGLNHRPGPSRLWVDLARRLARHGFASFRFDVSGLGDSAPRPGLGSDIERSILDMEDALAWLAEHVAPRFLLASLCSGTDISHQVAVRDSRVVAAIFLDGYTYPTPRFFAHRYLLGSAMPARWHRWLRRRYPQKFGLQLDHREVGAADEIFKREYPSVETFEADIAKIVDRGGRLLFVYSGETGYQYRAQLFDWLRRKDWFARVTVEYFPKANHTYTFETEREVMLRRAENWILELRP